MKAAVITVALASPLVLHWAIVWESDALLWSFFVIIATSVLAAGIERGRIAAALFWALLLLGASVLVDTELLRAITPAWAVLVYVAMGWLFGRSLRKGAMTICEQLARMEHPEGVPPELPAYARTVTILWTWTFAVLALATFLMMAFASTEALSLFTNILSWLVIGGLFIGEYVYRTCWKFPDLNHKNPVKLAISIARNAPQLLR
jgi:uncharacterized membrane protein